MPFGWGKPSPSSSLSLRESSSSAELVLLAGSSMSIANLPFTGESHDAYNQVQNSDNQAELSHEVLAGGASFAAFKMFEDRQRKEGT